MKPKYSIGETVRIKATGEKVKIVKFGGMRMGTPSWYVQHDDKNIIWRWETSLKPYRPSRTGIRAKNGRFVSPKSLIEMVICNQCDKKFETVNEYEQHAYHVHLYPDSKQRNYQKILTKLDVIEKKIDELGRKVCTK